MADADDTASDEEVVRIGRHQTAVGNLVDALAVPLVAGAPCAVNAVGGVQVDRPAAERNGVVVLVLFDDVLLGQHVVALEPPAFAFAGEKPDPFERVVLHFRVLARIFDVIPDAVDDFPEFEFDFFGIPDRVQPSAVLQPPVFAAVLRGVEILRIPEPGDQLLDLLQGEFGSFKAYGAPRVLDVEQDAVPQQFAVSGLVGRELLAVFFAVLGAHAVFGSRHVGERAVARTVGEKIAFDRVVRSGLRIERRDRSDGAAGHFGVVYARVEVKRDVRFGEHLVDEHHVEQHGIAFPVAEGVLDQYFVDDAPFARPAVVVAHVRGRSQRPQADFARSVAAQHGTVLNQRDVGARTGRGNGAAYAGKPAADDHQTVTAVYFRRFAAFFEFSDKHMFICFLS